MRLMTSALVVDAVVLFAVLEADPGPLRKVGAFRLLRPFVVAASIIPLFIKPVVTRGHGLDAELILAAVGIALGLLANWLMPLRRGTATARVVTAAGVTYSLVRIVVIGARAAFSYGAAHWFTRSPATWQIHHQVSTATVTDAIIFNAVGLILARTGLPAIRAHHEHLAAPVHTFGLQPAGQA